MNDSSFFKKPFQNLPRSKSGIYDNQVQDQGRSRWATTVIPPMAGFRGLATLI